MTDNNLKLGQFLLPNIAPGPAVRSHLPAFMPLNAYNIFSLQCGTVCINTHVEMFGIVTLLALGYLVDVFLQVPPLWAHC